MFLPPFRAMHLTFPRLSATALATLLLTLTRPAAAWAQHDMRAMGGHTHIVIPEGAGYTEVDVAFMQGMIAHHGQAIYMSRLAAAHKSDPRVVLRAVAAERRAAASAADRRLELVWTGPERDGAGTRDTAVVVRELLSQADGEILLSGYAVFGGKILFASVAERRVTHRGAKDWETGLGIGLGLVGKQHVIQYHHISAKRLDDPFCQHITRQHAPSPVKANRASYPGDSNSLIVHVHPWSIRHRTTRTRQVDVNLPELKVG